MNTTAIICANVCATPIGIKLGALLKQSPVIPNGTPTSAYDITDVGFKVVSSVATTSETGVTLEYGTVSEVYTDTVTAAESPISATGDVNFTLTGLTPYTDYYYRIKAVNSAGTAYSQEFVQRTIFNALLTATGNGTGVSTLRLEVSENQTLTITSGNARFYTDAAGTTGESTTWAITTGALRTIYLKAPSGNSVLNIPKPDKVIKWGNNIGSENGYTYNNQANTARITIEWGKLSIDRIYILGRVTLIGDEPATLGIIYIVQETGSNIIMSKSTAFNNITSIVISGNLINITTLNFGNANMNAFSLFDYRTDKMSSADMVTLLGQLTSRTGSLPNTITINDYADWASPPTSVTNAVAALKAAKPNVTTVNLGA